MLLFHKGFLGTVLRQLLQEPLAVAELGNQQPHYRDVLQIVHCETCEVIQNFVITTAAGSLDGHAKAMPTDLANSRSSSKEELRWNITNAVHYTSDRGGTNEKADRQRNIDQNTRRNDAETWSTLKPSIKGETQGRTPTTEMLTDPLLNNTLQFVTSTSIALSVTTTSCTWSPICAQASESPFTRGFPYLPE